MKLTMLVWPQIFYPIHKKVQLTESCLQSIVHLDLALHGQDLQAPGPANNVSECLNRKSLN